jgi:hypothetical protein
MTGRRILLIGHLSGQNACLGLARLALATSVSPAAAAEVGDGL